MEKVMEDSVWIFIGLGVLCVFAVIGLAIILGGSSCDPDDDFDFDELDEDDESEDDDDQG